jgi:hypothetical protein
MIDSFSGFHLPYCSLISLCFAQASGFSAPGAVGGLPEERGGAADQVATGILLMKPTFRIFVLMWSHPLNFDFCKYRIFLCAVPYR